MAGKKKSPLLALVLALVLIPSLLLNFLLFQKTQKLGQGIKVLEVLDGDTILLDGKVEKDIGEDWFCSEKEAQKAGFKKAKTCD